MDMDDSAANTSTEGVGGGPGIGTPASDATSGAQRAGTGGSEAPPTGGTPAATAQPTDDSTDWKKRYDDTEKWGKEKASEAKRYQEQLDAYRQQYGELPDPNAQTPQQDPWSILSQPQASQTPPEITAQMQNLPPHMQGVVSAIDEAFLSGNAARGLQIAHAYGLLGSHQAPPAPQAQSGLTQEQVQEMINAGIRQSVETAQKVDDALNEVAARLGSDFMNGEIEFGGVKTTRERALTRFMEQRGTTDSEAALWQIDPSGITERIRQKAISDYVAQQQVAAAAGQLPSVAPAIAPPQPTDAMKASNEAMGLPTKPPEGDLKSILTGKPA